MPRGGIRRQSGPFKRILNNPHLFPLSPVSCHPPLSLLPFSLKSKIYKIHLNSLDRQWKHPSMQNFVILSAIEKHLTLNFASQGIQNLPPLLPFHPHQTQAVHLH